MSGLLVIARNSSFAYKGRSIDLRQVTRELGVRNVLEGSVRRAGNRVRITAQLIDAATGGHLWAERFDRELTDIFAIQDEVTLRFVDALRVRLTPSEKADIIGAGTANTEAHDCFLRLRSLLYRPGLSGDMWRRAISYGERAIELDPGFSQAYAMLAIVHMLDFHNHWSGDSADQVLSTAGSLAERAIESDANEPMAHQAVVVVARWKGDYELAISAIEKTLSKSPDLALALFARSEISMACGNSRNAVPDFERAIMLDPGFTHQYLQFLGMAHQLLGNYETAVLLFRERLLLVPETDIGRAWLASSLGHLGETAKARAIWKEILEINPEFTIEKRLAKLAFVNPSDLANVMEGLAKSGLPE